MLNVHLNGDLVRCPDIRAIHARLVEQRLAQCRCKYGFEELKCFKWVDYCNNRKEIKPISQFGRCFLSGSAFCPMHSERKINGLKTKNFQITNDTYRKLSSSAHYLVKKSEYKTLFLTLTFPKFKRYASNKEINQYFSRFMENLRKRHNCSGYIAVREFGSKHGRVHFHILLAIGFIPFPVINRIWCDTISDMCEFAPNAVTSDAKTRFIKNPVRALRYVCKYFAKCKGKPSESRLVFISNNIRIKHKTFNSEDSEFFTVNDLLDKYKSISVAFTSDYTTAYRINDPNEFDSFCQGYLYKIFNLDDKNQSLYTYYPENTS